MRESLLLKWGTVKGWAYLSAASQKLLTEYYSDGEPLSCMTDHPSPERKSVLCELIDQIDGVIQNDWSGEILTKEAAKKYILEYDH